MDDETTMVDVGTSLLLRVEQRIASVEENSKWNTRLLIVVLLGLLFPRLHLDALTSGLITFVGALIAFVGTHLQH